MSRTEEGAVQRLLELLAEERAAMLEGNFAALPAFVSEKTVLVPAVENAMPDQAMLERLKSAAASNQALLSAALRGVHAARKRIEAARNGGAVLSTYDASGKAASFGARKSSFERRA